ncbi:glycoside hydrolase family 36 protein [Zobellia galactanivorans]|uniref:glycoside hydrolase family 36 protein n=1 Tax=Zobellia galactanivorans (strain DSM 12802 / CCUG 47099 / CIP 106680 / NCIMB 13871 / Dsij) TaxID=63186 RepID=UPI001C079404|nr:alpha-galactosidase [Zobellia galactanivorans]MBU3028398.1 alpha-galactosidase [Zobellia galactanivorans]
MKNILVHLIVLHFAFVAISQDKKKSFTLSGNSVTLTYESSNCEIEVLTSAVADGIDVATITLKGNKKFIPGRIFVKWSAPATNIAGYWSSQAFLDKTITPDWGPAKVTSMLAREAPVMTLYGYDDLNRQTFAVSEALNTVVTSTSVKEENGVVYNEIQLFSEPHKEILEYTIKLYLDTRAVHFSQALKDVSRWWEGFDMYKPAPVPEAANLPVYSTWYSYHQNVGSNAILKECRQAKGMGYETVIVDDGWQTMDSKRGYAFTGDWQPERIPEMKQLVKEVHDIGMKFMLWYAVPFVGENSSAYTQMQGKFLDYWEGQGTYVLDPRYPEVREFIINTYVRAIKEWDLDGFKLDFIGRFRANKNTVLTAENGRDYASVNLATDKLMTDLMTALRQIKPDVLIEFRQPYTGPLMRKYGNMLRASDCPNAAMVNRVETTDLRLVSGNTSVHADMLMWHYDDPVETAALQFLNVLYSVPQISVRLADIPKDHHKMIEFYTDYWLNNRDVLLQGEFYAESPLMNYPLIRAKNNRKMITTVFSERVVDIDTTLGLDIDVVNAKSTQKIIIDNRGEAREYQCFVFDCMGNTLRKEQVKLNNGISVFEVPPSGLIQLVAL